MFKYSAAAAALIASSPVQGLAPMFVSRPIGPGVKRYGVDRSKYMPHQGPREIARRIRQAERDRKRQEHRGIVKLGTYAFVGCDEQGRDTDTMRYSRRGRLLTCA